MPTDPLEFTVRVGTELSQLLDSRSRAELQELPPNEQFSAALGAALICAAEILRGPITRGVPAARLAALCAKQIEQLLAHKGVFDDPPPSSPETGREDA